MFSLFILAHLLGDFVLQNRWLVQRKHTAAGLAIHTGMVCLAMVLVAGHRLGDWWPWIATLTLIHGATDWAKVRLQSRLAWRPIILFLADQAVHVAAIAGAAVLAGPAGRESPSVSPAWWIAAMYILATFGISIALPLWLDPAGFPHRPVTARAMTIVAAAVALTLAWQGLAILIPLVAVGLYEGLARRMAQTPATASFPVEFWTAIVVAASLGWTLS